MGFNFIEWTSPQSIENRYLELSIHSTFHTVGEFFAWMHAGVLWQALNSKYDQGLEIVKLTIKVWDVSGRKNLEPDDEYSLV